MPDMPDDPCKVYGSDDPNVLGMVVIVDRGEHADMVIHAKRISPATFADMLQSAVDQIRGQLRDNQARRN